MTSKEREANFDLLRIVAMFFVVTIHYFLYGGAVASVQPGTANFMIISVLSILDRVCVNCFYLLSGYFLTKNENVDYKKLLDYWGKLVFFSVSIPAVLMMFGYLQMKPFEIVKTFFPILSNQYWFASVFLVIVFISPILSKAISALTHQQLTYFVFALFFFDCIQPMFFHNALGEGGYGLVHGLFMVLVGVCIKRVNFTVKRSWTALAGYFLALGLGYYTNLLWSELFHYENGFVWYYNSPFVVVASAALFLFFKQIKLRNAAISAVAPYIFAVYLVNDNPYLRKVVYTDFLKCDLFYNSPYFFLHYMISCAAFLAAGILIDFLRERVCVLLGTVIKSIKRTKKAMVDVPQEIEDESAKTQMAGNVH